MFMRAVQAMLQPRARKALGELEWLGDFVHTHRATLLGAARDEGLTGEDAVDAVQDAVVTVIGKRAWHAVGQRPDEALRLLVTVVRNQARNARRRRRPVEPVEAAKDVSTEAMALEASLDSARRHAALTGCLTTLGGTRRAVVTARLLEQTPTEIAQTLGLSPNHVAVMFHRARADLRDCLLRSHFRSAARDGEIP